MRNTLIPILNTALPSRLALWNPMRQVLYARLKKCRAIEYVSQPIYSINDTEKLNISRSEKHK